MGVHLLGCEYMGLSCMLPLYLMAGGDFSVSLSDLLASLFSLAVRMFTLSASPFVLPERNVLEGTYACNHCLTTSLHASDIANNHLMLSVSPDGPSYCHEMAHDARNNTLSCVPTVHNHGAYSEYDANACQMVRTLHDECILQFFLVSTFLFTIFLCDISLFYTLLYPVMLPSLLCPVTLLYNFIILNCFHGASLLLLFVIT